MSIKEGRSELPSVDTSIQGLEDDIKKGKERLITTACKTTVNIKSNG